jgi:hypothetical protein
MEAGDGLARCPPKPPIARAMRQSGRISSPLDGASSPPSSSRGGPGSTNRPCRQHCRMACVQHPAAVRGGCSWSRPRRPAGRGPETFTSFVLLRARKPRQWHENAGQLASGRAVRSPRRLNAVIASAAWLPWRPPRDGWWAPPLAAPRGRKGRPCVAPVKRPGFRGLQPCGSR